MSGQTNRIAAMIGNLLEHYDAALFGLLAPFIAPLFFPHQDPVVSLTLTYGMLCVGVFSKPLGSFYFGWIGDRWGRRHALFISLTGMALVTFGMGFLPTHAEIGGGAPLFLGLARLLQNFFSAGEVSGGAIFVLEHTEEKRRTFLSSLYDSGSILGILLASGLITLLSLHGEILDSWRYLFWGGGLVAVMGLVLRFKTEESPEFLKTKREGKKLLRALYSQRRAFFNIMLASGFSYAIYSSSFTLMNGFVPLVTSHSKGELMQLNTGLLAFDLFLLPLLGLLAQKMGKKQVMRVGAGVVFLSAAFLFSQLEGACLAKVIGIRLCFMVCGVAFAAPYYAWGLEETTPSHRYLILSLGTTLGSQVIGLPTAAVSLWLYQKTGWVVAPAFYLMFVSCGALFALRKRQRLRDDPAV